MTIKANPGHVIKAYLVDINPFCHGLVRKVLIDECGMVFVDGWHNIQDSYHVIPLPGQIAVPQGVGHSGMWGHLWDDWWESPAWKNEAWAWTHMQKHPQFQACYVIDNHDGTHSIFAH